jgi:hypothetical protein
MHTTKLIQSCDVAHDVAELLDLHSCACSVFLLIVELLTMSKKYDLVRTRIFCQEFVVFGFCIGLHCQYFWHNEIVLVQPKHDVKS